jgi:hypothetical protein
MPSPCLPPIGKPTRAGARFLGVWLDGERSGKVTAGPSISDRAPVVSRSTQAMRACRRVRLDRSRSAPQ